MATLSGVFVGDWTAHPRVAREACDFAAAKLATCFPATVPAVRATDVAGQLLARFNDLAVQVLTTMLCLPPEAHAAPQRKGAAPGACAAVVAAQAGSAAALNTLVTACASASNAYACFSMRTQEGGTAVGAAAPGGGELPSQAQAAAPRWLEALLGYCRGVLLEGVAVGALAGVAGAKESIPASAASFSTALRALQASEPWVRVGAAC